MDAVPVLEKERFRIERATVRGLSASFDGMMFCFRNGSMTAQCSDELMTKAW